MIREISKNDFNRLSELYTHLHGNKPIPDNEMSIENIVTHKVYRKRGLASQCLAFAKQIAVENNCYKMMLLTGSKKRATHRFYRKNGYNSIEKTGYIQRL